MHDNDFSSSAGLDVNSSTSSSSGEELGAYEGGIAIDENKVIHSSEFNGMGDNEHDGEEELICDKTNINNSSSSLFHRIIDNEVLNELGFDGVIRTLIDVSNNATDDNNSNQTQTEQNYYEQEEEEEEEGKKGGDEANTRNNFVAANNNDEGEDNNSPLIHNKSTDLVPYDCFVQDEIYYTDDVYNNMGYQSMLLGKYSAGTLTMEDCLSCPFLFQELRELQCGSIAEFLSRKESLIELIRLVTIDPNAPQRFKSKVKQDDPTWPDKKITKLPGLSVNAFALRGPEWQDDEWSTFVFSPAQETSALPSDPHIFKYPNVAQEILMDENERIQTALLQDHEALDALFSVLSRREPLSGVIGQYSITLMSYISSRTEFFAYLESRIEQFIDDCFYHLEHRPVAEMLKSSIMNERIHIQNPGELMHRLIENLDPTLYPDDISIGERAENVFLITREIISSGSAGYQRDYFYYIEAVSSPRALNVLMECVMHWSKTVVTSATGILVEVIMIMDDPHAKANMSYMLLELDEVEREQTAKAINNNDANDNIGREIKSIGENESTESSSSCSDDEDHDLHDSFIDNRTIKKLTGVDIDELSSEVDPDNDCSINHNRARKKNNDNNNPMPYRSSGHFIDKALRPHLGRIICEILEPLTAAAATQREHRERKQKVKEKDPRNPYYRFPREPGVQDIIDPSVPILTGVDWERRCIVSGDDPEVAPDDYVDDAWFEFPERLPPNDIKSPALITLEDPIATKHEFSETRNHSIANPSGIVLARYQNGVRPIVGPRLIELLNLLRALVRCQGSKTFRFYLPKIIV